VKSFRLQSAFFRSVLLAASATLLATAPAWAQNSGGSPGYFIPHAAAPAHPVHTRQQQMPLPQGPMQGQQMPGEPGLTQAAEQPKMPPIPNLPALPKAKPPPSAVIGVLAVTQVMQNSAAAQAVQKIIEGRRADLAAQARARGLKFQDEQKAINGEKKKLSKAAIVKKQEAMQRELEAAQVSFHNKNIAIQISARTALAKIEATLIAVIRQVSQAHGMNLVLHRSQVALNVNAFDISKEVTDQLNKILPSVAVPPSVVPKNVANAHQ
jgi:Skp family chaperone for outer membrane proteins